MVEPNFENLSTEQQIRFLIQSQKSLSDNIEKLYETTMQQKAEYKAEQERLDRRERQAREALLSGIAAYLRALNGGESR